MYHEITKDVICYFASGNVPRKKQEKTGFYIYPARKAEDGKINWAKPAREILNLVRAVTAPYPGAFCGIGHDKLFVWKANLIEKMSIPFKSQVWSYHLVSVICQSFNVEKGF